MQVEVLKLGAGVGRSIERGTAAAEPQRAAAGERGRARDDQRIERLAAGWAWSCRRRRRQLPQPGSRRGDRQRAADAASTRLMPGGLHRHAAGDRHARPSSGRRPAATDGTTVDRRSSARRPRRPTRRRRTAHRDADRPPTDAGGAGYAPRRGASTTQPAARPTAVAAHRPPDRLDLSSAFWRCWRSALARAADLGVLKAGSLQHAAVSQQITRDVIPATRGTITDRNGVQLAISESADEVVADPYLIKHPQTVAQKLAPLLGQPVPTVLRRADQAAHRLRATRLPAAGRPGDADHEARRSTGSRRSPRSRAFTRATGSPRRCSAASHRDGQGASGLEYRYNQQLAGTNGLRPIVNDAIGQPISIDDVRPMQPGQDARADDRRRRSRTRSSRCSPASAPSTRPRARPRS